MEVPMHHPARKNWSYKMFEVAGNMHMHTLYSDGEKWHAGIADDAIKAGLDFIIVTDHNVWVQGVEGYYENENGRVLLLSGEEIHNVRRQPQASHCLVYGAERELAPCATNPQELIDVAKACGGYTFLAHPHEKNLELFDQPSLAWGDWDIEGFTGLEIWNYMSGLKNELVDIFDKWRFQHHWRRMLTAVDMAFKPEKYITGPDPNTMKFWDKLLSEGKRIAAIGGSDAHATPMSLGPIKQDIYPYDFLFRAVNTHVLLPEPLSGDLAHDKQMILTGIGNGRSWVGYDMPRLTKGFRFHGHSSSKGIMGDKIKLNGGATLQIKAPAPSRIRLIRHGDVVAEVENESHLTHIPTEPGAYRVECWMEYLGKERGWIFSNPIYLW
jgi:hypothetical protein